MSLEERYRRNGTDEWQARGSASEHHRYSIPAPSRTRRLCRCGCRSRASYSGMANGVCLIMGCQMHVARWVRDPRNAQATIRPTPAKDQK